MPYARWRRCRGTNHRRHCCCSQNGGTCCSEFAQDRRKLLWRSTICITGHYCLWRDNGARVENSRWWSTPLVQRLGLENASPRVVLRCPLWRCTGRGHRRGEGSRRTAATVVGLPLFMAVTPPDDGLLDVPATNLSGDRDGTELGEEAARRAVLAASLRWFLMHHSSCSR